MTTTAGAAPVHLNLPLSQSECLACANWLNTHYGGKIAAAVQGSPFDKALIYGIACQETAIEWVHWIDHLPPQDILARCVFDASGDVNGTRLAFPKNTATFTAKFGQPLANMLIAEANTTRALHNWGPKPWVYAGYGLFQYDIQNILTDPDFFVKKQWYDIDACVSKVMAELYAKWKAHPGDLFNTVKAYNGSGQRANNYANNVFQFVAWIKAGLPANAAQ